MAEKTSKEEVMTYFGTRKSDGVQINLTPPSWDCEWYWSLGYLGNRHEHYHLSSYADGRNINMYDALLKDYDLAENIKENLWTFCELMVTAYQLKETAAVFGRGGSHYTVNPVTQKIKRPDLAKEINEVMLPALFAELKKITG
jgi:hypothetical protein